MNYRVLRIPAGLVFAFLVVFAPRQVCAQTIPSSVTPEQLQMLQSLPADQQKAILERMSRSSSSSDLVPTDETDINKTPGGSEGTQKDKSASKKDDLTVQRGPPRIAPQSTVLLSVDFLEATSDPGMSGAQAPKPNTLLPILTEQEKALIKERRERILAGNPYVVSGTGQLLLPALPPITLWGLTATEAAQRLNADPHLLGLKFKVNLLPIVPVGADALTPFGYDIFTSEDSSFAPPTNLPVPTGYIVGPGDTILLDFFGRRAGRYSLVVDRDGRVHLPDLGPLEVAGLSFDQVKATIESRVSKESLGSECSVTMGPLRSIRVFVTGDVKKPGSYMVSGLSTVTNALFASGGVSKIGSLRNLEIKRKSTLVGKLDLYALLLHGDSSGDVRLEPGDVVFVPPVGATAGVTGEVRRPAIYELREGDTVADLLALSGGLAPEADPHGAKLERIDGGSQRVIMDIDVGTSAGLTVTVRAGDVLTVPRVLDEMARTVTLQGEVLRPGKHSWHEQMRLTELLSGLNALKEDADQRYILIRREHFPDRRLSVLSADAIRAFEAPGSDADPVLQSRDLVIVFPLQSDRGVTLGEVLKQLRAQARDKSAPPVVSISGHTIAPGDYPLEPGMRVSDLIRAGGGLDSGAYDLDAELTRVDFGNGQAQRTEVVPIKLSAVLARDAAADLQLRPYDTLTVKEIPDWTAQGAITLKGEVRFPGRYPITKGETLSSVIRRAGGLTPFAFPEGAVFTRDEIKQQERQQLDNLAKRMQADLTTLALQSTQGQEGKNAAEALGIGQNLLAQLRNTEPVGRLVIDVRRAINLPGRAEDDVQLRPGDALTIPRLRQYVTVIGEVENPTSHIWKRGLTRADYVQLSGGTTLRADTSRIYVVRADGSVVPREASSWFSRSSPYLRMGDTIVVPLDAQRMPTLTKWQAVTQILYNIAIATAAIHGL
jgi:protein involved in polysaccharide export with SLBB domain